MRFSRGQIENHLRKIGVGPREPRSGIVGRVVYVLSFVDQTESSGVLEWYVSRLLPGDEMARLTFTMVHNVSRISASSSLPNIEDTNDIGLQKPESHERLYPRRKDTT